MKKVAAGLLSIASFAAPLTAFAQFDITVNQNGRGINKGTEPSTVINNVLIIFFTVGGIIALFMLLTGAIQWITSGGDKEAVGHARGRVTHALIGIVVMGLAFFILRVIGSLVGFDVTQNQTLPRLDQ